jgi:hypothetical protein
MRLFVAIFAVSAAACGEVPGTGGSGGGSQGGSGGGSSGVGGGSSSGPGIDREALSGSRLKNRYLEGDDGSKMPLGFYDTARSENCGFATADDGRWRCLPLEGILYYDPQSATKHFADAACTQPIVATSSPGGCAAPYAYHNTPACPVTWSLYPATWYTPTVVYAHHNVDTCDAEAPAAGSAYYRVGPKIAPTEFVAGTDKHE